MERPTDHIHRVLVVDDDRDTREAFTAALEIEGFVIAAADSAAAALETLRGGFHPCVALVDVRMPNITGWGFWERVRVDPTLADLPVVMLSSEGQDRGSAQARGIRDVLLKPIAVAEFVRVVEEQCGATSAA